MSVDSTNKRVTIVVSGRVQGVAFRKSAKRVADSHGLVGFARNLPDGRVEIVAEGSSCALRALLDWCYRGSLLAHVDGLSFEWQEVDGSFDDFSVDWDKRGIVADQIHAFTNLGRRLLDRVDKKVDKVLEPVKVPKHVVIIPDGNRRWARERDLPVWRGHQEGFERTKELVKAAKDEGVSHLTFWGFSTENWGRPKEEVDWLMDKFAVGIQDMAGDLVENRIGFKHFGRKDRLSKKLVQSIDELEHKTKDFENYKFAIALDYGGRDEITRAVNSLEGEVTEDKLGAALDTSGFPDPDLIIRTSGEQRTSGIMPWQGVYSELYFSPVHYPDFGATEFAYALEDYATRNRRFGKS